MDPSCEIRLIPVRFEGEIVPGDDLAEKLAAALKHQKLKLQTGDVLVVKHKIVSKAEGQVVPLSSVKPSPAAKSWSRRSGSDVRVIELALSESRRIVRKKKGALITETRHGLICANSGVDVSNVDGGNSAVCCRKIQMVLRQICGHGSTDCLGRRSLSSSPIPSDVPGAKA